MCSSRYLPYMCFMSRRSVRGWPWPKSEACFEDICNMIHMHSYIRRHDPHGSQPRGLHADGASAGDWRGPEASRRHTKGKHAGILEYTHLRLVLLYREISWPAYSCIFMHIHAYAYMHISALRVLESAFTHNSHVSTHTCTNTHTYA